MRRIALVGLALAMTACGSWKGDGTDEVLPDVVGRATGARPSTGVLVQILGEQADQDLIKGPLVFFSEPNNKPASPEAEEGPKAGEAPAEHPLPPGMHHAEQPK